MPNPPLYCCDNARFTVYQDTPSKREEIITPTLKSKINSKFRSALVKSTPSKVQSPLVSFHVQVEASNHNLFIQQQTSLRLQISYSYLSSPVPRIFSSWTLVAFFMFPSPLKCSKAFSNEKAFTSFLKWIPNFTFLFFLTSLCLCWYEFCSISTSMLYQLTSPLSTLSTNLHEKLIKWSNSRKQREKKHFDLYTDLHFTGALKHIMFFHLQRNLLAWKADPSINHHLYSNVWVCTISYSNTMRAESPCHAYYSCMKVNFIVTSAKSPIILKSESSLSMCKHVPEVRSLQLLSEVQAVVRYGCLPL